MRRTVLLIMMVALSLLVFAPVAVAQDDNPSADDRGGAEDRGMDDRGFDDNGGGVRTFDDNPTGADDVMASPTASATASAVASAVASAAASATPTAAAGGDDNPSADDLGGDDRGGQRAFDDNPTGDDATATATAMAGAGRDDDAAASVGGSLPDTGGMSPLPGAAGVLFLVGSGITAAMLLRRTS